MSVCDQRTNLTTEWMKSQQKWMMGLMHCLLLFFFVSKCCSTDNDWGVSDFPIVLGHEGIGTVRRVGDSVKGLKVGDVVGVTWLRDSCACCGNCLEGRENLYVCFIV